MLLFLLLHPNAQSPPLVLFQIDKQKRQTACHISSLRNSCDKIIPLRSAISTAASECYSYSGHNSSALTVSYRNHHAHSLTKASLKKEAPLQQAQATNRKNAIQAYRRVHLISILIILQPANKPIDLPLFVNPPGCGGG